MKKYSGAHCGKSEVDFVMRYTGWFTVVPDTNSNVMVKSCEKLQK